MKNKKKVISLTLIIIALFTGTVFASTNGLFEGFSIVNVVVNGKTVKGDVPGINFHGRTMVPLRLIGEELGVDISWDGNTSTAYVTSNNVINSSTTQQSIDELKLYSRITHQYYELQNLGDMLFDRSHSVGSIMNNINMLNIIDSFNSEVEYFDSVIIEYYNGAVDSVDELIKEANTQGINISDMNDILNDYYDSIEYYKTSFQYISKYYNSKDKSNSDNVYDNAELAFNAASRGITKAMGRYYHFVTEMQGY